MVPSMTIEPEIKAELVPPPVDVKVTITLPKHRAELLMTYLLRSAPWHLTGVYGLIASELYHALNNSGVHAHSEPGIEHLSWDPSGIG